VNPSFHFDAVERITAGAVGEPGERVFFVQARARGADVTLLAEKEQVRLLSEGISRLLGQLPESDEGPAPAEEDLALSPPLEPMWRVGEMAIEYDEASDRIAIVLREVSSEQEADDEAAEPEDVVEEDLAAARFVATRAQVRAMADHALKVVAAGRPRCQFCNAVLEGDGSHMCAAMNGHKAPKSAG